MSSYVPKQRIGVERIEGFLKETHKKLEKIMNTLENQEMNWRPSENINSIGNLLKHIIGSEAFWIHHVVGGLETQRVRTSEFEIKDFILADLQNELNSTKNMTNNVISKLYDEQLSELRVYWSQIAQRNKETTVYWCLFHSIEHSALHVGQIFYIKKLYKDLAS